MYIIFSRNISNHSIMSLSNMYNTLFFKSSFNTKMSLLEPLTNIIKTIQEEHAEALAKNRMSKDFCKFMMKDYGYQIINRSLLFVPPREVIQIMFSSTSSNHFYLSRINQIRIEPNTLTFIVYKKLLNDFLKINFEKKKIGEFFNGAGYITNLCRSLQNSDIVEQSVGTIQDFKVRTSNETPRIKISPFPYLQNYKVLYLDCVLDKFHRKDDLKEMVLPPLNQESDRREIYSEGFAESEQNEEKYTDKKLLETMISVVPNLENGIKISKNMFSTNNSSKPKNSNLFIGDRLNMENRKLSSFQKRQMSWNVKNKEYTESLEHLQRDGNKSNTNQQTQQHETSELDIMQEPAKYPREKALLSKSSSQKPLMLEPPELSKELTETSCYQKNKIKHEKVNFSPTFRVTKRYLKKEDDSKASKIPAQVCKDKSKKKQFSNEKKIPAQACKDKIASKNLKRDVSTLNPGMFTIPELMAKKFRYQYTKKNKARRLTQKVGSSKRICIPKTPNIQQKMTYRNRIQSLIEPAKQYIQFIMVAGEIKIKNIINQITQSFNQLKNNPKEFLKSILLEQPEKDINEKKSKTVYVEKKDAKITVSKITDQLKTEPKNLNKVPFLKSLPVDHKPFIKKIKDALETSIETDFKRTFGNSFKESKSKITLNSLENLTKKDAAMMYMAYDKAPIESNKLIQSEKEYFFKKENLKRKENDYFLQKGKDGDVTKQKRAIDEGSKASETFLKKNWLLSKDNYCGKVDKKMDGGSGNNVYEKPEILFKNMSKITRLIQLETKKNNWLSEVEVVSSQETERNSERSNFKEKMLKDTIDERKIKNYLELLKKEVNLLEMEESCASGEKTSKSNTKQEHTPNELTKKVLKDDKSINSTAVLAQVKIEGKRLQKNKDSFLIGKRKPDRLDRPFKTPLPPPKKEEAKKKKKVPPPSPKGGMILPPRNVSDNPKIINKELPIKDELNSDKLKLESKDSSNKASNNKEIKTLQHKPKVEDKIFSDKPKPIHKDILSNNEEITELKHQPKEIIIAKKSKIEIFSQLPRKTKDKLVYAKDSDLKKLITLKDKENLRTNLRYILTLIEELDIEYKDGSDENLIKQSKEMDKIVKKQHKELINKTDAKLKDSVADKTNDLTKLEEHVQEKLPSVKVPIHEQDFPNRKLQQKSDKRLGASKENTQSKISTSTSVKEISSVQGYKPQERTSKNSKAPEENTKVKFSTSQDPAQLPHFSGYKLEQPRNCETTSKENEYYNSNVFIQNKSDLEKKTASTLMDFYHLDEESTSHETLIQKPNLKEKNPESSLMYFYLLDEDEKIPTNSLNDKKTELLIKDNKQGILIEKAKNNTTFTRTNNKKTALPGEIDKEGFKTNTFNVKEYQGIKETKQGILIEKQKNKVMNDTFNNLIKSTAVSKAKCDSIAENKVLQKNGSINSTKPASTTRSLTSSSKNNKCLEEKYMCNLHTTEEFSGGSIVHLANDKIEETNKISTLTDGCWNLNTYDGSRKFLFTQPQNFEEKTILDITLSSGKDDDVPPAKITSDKDKEKQLNKKKRVSKKKKTTNDKTLTVSHESKKRMKAPITIKKDPNKPPFVTVIFSKKRQVEKSNKGVNESKREKAVYKVTKKRFARSARDKTRSRKRNKKKRRNIILFLLKDEIKRRENDQAQIMQKHMSPNEKVDQALNKYRFNTPTEVSNDFNTIPSADVKMNQRMRTKERIVDKFHKNLDKKLFISKKVSKSKSDVKSEKVKKTSSEGKDNHNTNAMLADNNSESGCTYEIKHNNDKFSKSDKTNITNDDNSTTLEPKSMHDCLSSGKY